jgi:hypothetical protein
MAAKVFISCGQRNDSEKSIGTNIREYFESRDFVVYLAEQVHSLEGLTENIFRNLSDSDYFIFVDFRREKIKEEKGEDIYRGSLFVNQEIATATLLKLPTLGFRQRDIQLEGVLKFIIANAFEFDTWEDIRPLLESETKHWNPLSRNRLDIEFEGLKQKSRNINTLIAPNKVIKADWYHLQVTNLNNHKHALGCQGFVSKIRKGKSRQELKLGIFELIWSGMGRMEVDIPTKSKRELDAFFYSHEDGKIHFHHYTSSMNYTMPALDPNEYEIEYTIISDNFPTTTADFNLKFSSSSDSVVFDSG